MMQHNRQIFESLFNRDFSDSGNTAFLEALVDQHPYFSPAQFFLLEKKQGEEAAFEKQAVRTNILFNNPHWLYFQLKQTGPATENGKHEPVIAPEIATGPATVVTEALPPDAEIAEPDIQQEKEIEPMHIELKMPEENGNLDETMLFEPMHMVDYFASQGIKLSEDAQVADKLGKQLKSFTEWLKTMKKVHSETDTQNAPKTDASVQVLAENSNSETEVLTEAMAEVFARQGKLNKAREVYQKLSLLNPAKSTYFAAKLENLKGL